MSQSGYTLPVTVPVNSSYGDNSAGLMQSSPQMAHPSVSPRPSSSETDTVYPAESMLDMSNGYPPSASPLGSASPGPSPGIANKSMQQKQPSPSRSHLRVVIPTPQGPQGSLPSDDVRIFYPMSIFGLAPRKSFNAQMAGPGNPCNVQR